MGEGDGQPAAEAVMCWAALVLAEDAALLALVSDVAVLIAVMVALLVDGRVCA